jgi:hypothetical protein
MARPKGSGGRSRYDKYRKFGRTSAKFRLTGNRRRRSTSSGKFVRASGPLSKSRVRRGKKSRFDK